MLVNPIWCFIKESVFEKYKNNLGFEVIFCNYVFVIGC